MIHASEFDLKRSQRRGSPMDYFNAFNRVQVPFPAGNSEGSNFGQVTTKFSAINREGQIQATFNF